ncbi:hypothetical protein GCM10011494_01590 [Novosphingobium endophyticum]|uniref:Uncharacterized protein n=1 Tax=Novosphingobium endophyticum TaxID=1955250 RepID=A0A916X493_9SPHN|nr:hypothetical protein [Novosphingobium endophyticum]GGB86955.1 hypothetical protein GCM10011494_01590 [Novosphingobium endophyticum]
MRIDSGADRTMIETLRGGTGRRGAWLKLLSEVVALGGPDVEFLRHSERPWSSATFTGARHVIALAFTGRIAVDCGEQFIAALPDHEFTLPGQLVAEATIAAVEYENGPEPRMTVEAELLLLEDC